MHHFDHLDRFGLIAAIQSAWVGVPDPATRIKVGVASSPIALPGEQIGFRTTGGPECDLLR